MGLRKISKEELDKILELHKKWLVGDVDGVVANLSNVDLSGMDLRKANLSGAILMKTKFEHANLRRVDLRWAYLEYADLKHTDLRGADLRWSNLMYADLEHANLKGADFKMSNLKESYLNETDLRGADLRWANLNNTNLRGANLRGANLKSTDLSNSLLMEANLKEIKYDCETSFLALQCPEEGSFIGYKKSNDKIVKLRIEEDSLRSSATTRECRASKVTVLSITSINGKEKYKEVSNTGYYEFTYKVGETYEITNFDKDRWNECSAGIHFFITRDEAVRY